MRTRPSTVVAAVQMMDSTTLASGVRLVPDPEISTRSHHGYRLRTANGNVGLFTVRAATPQHWYPDVFLDESMRGLGIYKDFLYHATAWYPIFTSDPDDYTSDDADRAWQAAGATRKRMYVAGHGKVLVWQIDKQKARDWVRGER